jgi:hypothetical protein
VIRIFFVSGAAESEDNAVAYWEVFDEPLMFRERKPILFGRPSFNDRGTEERVENLVLGECDSRASLSVPTKPILLTEGSFLFRAF